MVWSTDCELAIGFFFLVYDLDNARLRNPKTLGEDSSRQSFDPVQFTDALFLLLGYL